MTRRRSTSPVVVIGAGVAGLASAGLLAREGHEVIVLERLDEVGGRAGQLVEGGYRWDLGPSWWLMPEAFERFYRQMGTSIDQELDLQPLQRPTFSLFTEGLPRVDVTSGRDSVAATFESVEPGAGARILEDLSALEADYELALEHFLYTNFTAPGALLDRRILRRLPRLLSQLTRSLERSTQHRHTDVRLRQVLSFASVFLSATPSTTPAFYGILNHSILTQGVSYPMGGFGSFIDSLYRLALRAGAQVRVGAEVSEITTDPTTRRVTGVRYRDADGEHRISTPRVVSAADRHHTETHLLGDSSASVRRRWKRANPGIGCVLAYLGVEGELPQLAHHSLFFSEDWSPDFARIFPDAHAGPTPGRDAASASVYVCRPSATDDTVAPEGHENLFVLIPVPAVAGGIRGSLGGDPDVETERIVDRTLALIAERAGIPDLGDRIVARHTVGPGDFEQRFHAWRGNALGLAHTLGQSAFLRGSNASSRARGLYFAGSTTTPGVGVPMCLISAENVAQRLRGDASAASPSSRSLFSPGSKDGGERSWPTSNT